MNTLTTRGNLDKDFRQDNKQFDVVISNPPYSVSAFKNAAREYYKDGDFELYERLTDNSSEIECLFIERTKQLLKDGGVAGVILPSSILSNTGIYTMAREVILQYFEIVAITELGSNTFMATGTNTVVLFLRRRNNYDSINLRKSIDSFFASFREVTLNGIENPVSKYVGYVWDTLSVADYITLLKKYPNKTVENTELFKEYKKKIKAKNGKEFWDILLDIEKDKLYYFILTYPQQVVIVRSGEKDAEKRFLGYEFSNRRGSEGIHPIERGKTIDQCTQLFDAEQFENPDKASTYIYKAFNGDFDTPIAEGIQKNISRARLVDMLNFDRVDFEKTISTSVKKKVNFEDIWSTSNLVLLSEIADIKKGTSITKNKTVAGSIPVIAGGQDIAYYHNISNRDGNVITISASGAYSGFVNYFSEPIFASDCSTVQSKDESVISTSLIFHFLKTIQCEIYALQKGQAQPHVYGEDIAKIKIPLPSKDIQEKIITEIEAISDIVDSANENIKNFEDKIESLLLSAKGDVFPLSEVAPFVTESTKLDDIPISAYVTTDNMLQDKLGITTYEGEPNISSITKYQIGDILISNIRPYLKKIWFADSNGGCSKDVLVFRNSNGSMYLSRYLYYALRRDSFFDYVMEDKKGVKMPRGDKENILKYKLIIPSIEEQQKIVAEIEVLEKEITKAQQIIDNAPALKAAILKKYL